MPVTPSGQVASLSNGTTEIGIAVPAPPTISIVSWARAGATASSANAAKAREKRTKLGKRILERERWAGGGVDARETGMSPIGDALRRNTLQL